MTGFGRTGRMFACEHAGIEPDLLCLSKGITGGYLPLSVVLARDEVFNAFYDDDLARGFLHSHSYSGNALACRAALAVLDLFRDGDVLADNRALAAKLDFLAQPIAAHPKVSHFRHMGMIWAFEVDTERANFSALVFCRGARARDAPAPHRPHRLLDAAVLSLGRRDGDAGLAHAGNCRMRLIASIACWCALLLASEANAALPQPVARAFLAERIPLSAVGAYVQEIGATKPLFTQQPGKAMNPASTMKLVTTFAALELLGPNYQWITEAYADGPIADGVLDGNLVLKGRGDPKITVEQFNDFVAHIRATGLSSIRGDLVLDRTWFDPGPYDPGAFDGEPLRPYNVGPDALAVNFKSVRFIFAPNAAGDGVDVRVDPPIGRVTVQGSPRLVPGDCGDWHATLQADFADRGDSAQAVFRGRYAQACGEREWYVALLDHPHYMLNLFARTWADSGGTFAGTCATDGRHSPPHGSRRSNRRRFTTRFATSTSCRTISWRGSFS